MLSAHPSFSSSFDVIESNKRSKYVNKPLLFELFRENIHVYSTANDNEPIHEVGILPNWQSRIHLCTVTAEALGAVSIRKTVLPGMAIPILKIRRPNGRLIFNMEIAIRR